MKKYSPGVGPGRVRSSAGLVNFLVLVLVIGIGEGLPSPLTPLPWATWAEKCLPDPSPKRVVSLRFYGEKTASNAPPCMHRLTQVFGQGGTLIRPSLSFQSLVAFISHVGIKYHHRPSKRRRKTPQDPPKTSQDHTQEQ